MSRVDHILPICIQFQTCWPCLGDSFGTKAASLGHCDHEFWTIPSSEPNVIYQQQGVKIKLVINESACKLGSNPYLIPLINVSFTPKELLSSMDTKGKPFF